MLEQEAAREPDQAIRRDDAATQNDATPSQCYQTCKPNPLPTPLHLNPTMPAFAVFLQERHPMRARPRVSMTKLSGGMMWQHRTLQHTGRTTLSEHLRLFWFPLGTMLAVRPMVCE
jgi:hypothetical protein